MKHAAAASLLAGALILVAANPSDAGGRVIIGGPSFYWGAPYPYYYPYPYYGPYYNPYEEADRRAMAQVRLTTEPALLSGCTRLGVVTDDSVKDMRRKIVRLCRSRSTTCTRCKPTCIAARRPRRLPPRRPRTRRPTFLRRRRERRHRRPPGLRGSGPARPALLEAAIGAGRWRNDLQLPYFSPPFQPRFVSTARPPVGCPLSPRRLNHIAGGPRGAARNTARSPTLVGRSGLHLLLELLLQRFAVDARALLHRRVLEEGLRVLLHLLLHEHEAPELEREPVVVRE
jgi:hypothetical protein